MPLFFLRQTEGKNQNKIYLFRRRRSSTVSTIRVSCSFAALFSRLIYLHVYCRCDEHSESDYVEFSNYMAHDMNYARHCGNLSAFSVTSIGNFFRVSFKSNNVLDGSGFRATYQFLNESSSRKKISNTNLAHIPSKSRVLK